MKKQYRFYRKIIQFWLLPKEPFTHVSLQVYSQKLSLIWCILQILHGFRADVDSIEILQAPMENWKKKKEKKIWDITVLQTNQPTIAYNQRALKEPHSTLTSPSRYFSVGHTELSCLGPPCSPTNLSLARLPGATTGKAVGMKYWATSLDLLHHLLGLHHQTELLSELLEAPTTKCFQLLAVRSAVHLRRHATHRGMWKREEKIPSHPPEISPWKTAPVGLLPECAAERFSVKNPTKSMAEISFKQSVSPALKREGHYCTVCARDWSCHLERLQRTSCGSPAESWWLLIDHRGWKWTPKATEC